MESDRRQAHRIPASSERENAILKVGDESIPARLVDESSMGIALQVDAHPGVYEGEAVWVQAAGSWTKARVARIRHEDSGIELGLVRITQTDDEPPVVEPKPWLRVWRLPENRRVPIIIALAVVLTVSLVTLLRHWQGPATGPKVQANQAADESSGPPADLQEEVRELAGLLDLSKRQIKHIEGIIARRQRAEELAQQTGATAEGVRRIRLKALHDARQILNRRQQARWDEIMRLVEEKDAGLD